MLRRAHLLPALAALTLLVALVAPATAQSTAPSTSTLTATSTVLGDRIVPEPSERATYISYAEFNGFLEQLQAAYPRYVAVGSMGKSEEGRDLVTLELTDSKSPVPYADREVVFISQGIHANEPGGREGMLRVAEDLLREAAVGDRDALDALGSLRVVQAVTNVDSWVSGDVGSLGLLQYRRENADGVDLNRQSPWPGRYATSRNFENQAESRAMVADADRRRASERVVGSADVHGMIQDESAVWTMYSSGQFDLGGWARQMGQAATIDERVREALGPIEGIRALTGELGSELVTPHRTTTSSEFQGGLSGSGFYGDFLAQPHGVDSASVSTIELFVNNGPVGTYNQLTYFPTIVQLHVDSVRAIVRGLIETAMTEQRVSLSGTGRVGVVDNLAEVAVPQLPTTRTDEDVVTPRRFFDDLDPYLDAPTERLAAGEITAEALEPLDVLVVGSDEGLSAGAIAAMGAFANSGGTLVLTDEALQLLADYDAGIDPADVTRAETMIGNATFTDFDHHLAEGVRSGEHEEALHTYEPSTLGYNTEGSSGEAPVWRIDRDAFEAAGGDTVATTGGQTSIGELSLGDGTVRLIGGLLPPPTTQNATPYGLYNYAPNDTGYLVFANALEGDLTVEDVGAPSLDTQPDPSPAPADRVSRVEGEGRVETAAAVAREGFDEAATVFIARADLYPDALAGAPLAASEEAPLLLSSDRALSPAAAEVIDELGASRAVLLGGVDALSEQVARDLEEAGLEVDRVSGPNRFATAVAIAERMGADGSVFLAAGGPPPNHPNPDAAGWPDAVAVAPYAGFRQTPILLGLRDSLPDETAAALAALKVSETVIVGGNAVIGDAIEERLEDEGRGPRRLAGDTRYGTSRAVADEAIEAGMDGARLWLATGRAFPDALGAGPVVALLGEVLLLVDGVDLAGSPETAELITSDTERVRILGGVNAVSERTESQVRRRLGE